MKHFLPFSILFWPDAKARLAHFGYMPNGINYTYFTPTIKTQPPKNIDFCGRQWNVYIIFVPNYNLNN